MQRIPATYNRRRVLAGFTTAAVTARRSSFAPVRAQTDGGALRFALSASDRDRVLPILAEFTAETGIEVTPVTFTNQYQSVSVELTRGACSFDVVSLDDPWLPIFAGGRFLLPLDQLSDQDGSPFALDAFVPSFATLGLAPGTTELFAIPWIGNIQLFGYRPPEVIASGVKPPQDWEDVRAIAASVTARATDRVYGIGFRGRPGPPVASTFLTLLRAHGGTVLDAHGEIAVDRNVAAAALEVLLKLTAFAPPAMSDLAGGTLEALLTEGTIAQAINVWPSQLLWPAGAGAPTLSPSTATIVTPKAVRNAVPPITGCWLLGIPQACAAGTAAVALTLIRWLTTAAAQEKLLLRGGLPPTRRDVLANDALEAQVPLLTTLRQQAPGAEPRTSSFLFPAAEQIIGDWVGRAVAGEIDGDFALQQMLSELNDVIARPR